MQPACTFSQIYSWTAGEGYGDMHAVPHYKQLTRQPRHDGLWLIDIPTKEAKLLISIWELSRQLRRGPMGHAKDPLTAQPYNTTTGTESTSFTHGSNWQQCCNTVCSLSNHAMLQRVISMSKQASLMALGPKTLLPVKHVLK